MPEFTYRTARSGSVTVAVSTVVLIETLALHLLIATRHPLLAWVLTIISLGAVLWIIRDYRALGAGVVRVDAQTLYLEIGRRFDFTIPVAAVARATTPGIRDLPTPGTNQGKDFANLTKPTKPNILLTLTEPRPLRIMPGVSRTVKRIAFRLDDPAGFLRTLETARATESARTA